MPWLNPRRDAILREQGDDGNATLCSAPASTDRPAPESGGEVIVILDRPSKFGKPAEQVRLEIAEYNTHKYLSLRVWTENAQGQWWPVAGKGMSIRCREARELADALHAAMDRIEGDDPHDEPSPRRSTAEDRGSSQGHQQAPPRPSGDPRTWSRDDRQLPAATGYGNGDGFNEY